MKITSLAIIALLLAAFTADAQTIKPKSMYAKQKTFEIGGNIFFTSETFKTEINGKELDDNDRRTFTANINFGIFVIDGLKLGIEPAIQFIDYGHDDSQTQLKLFFTPEYVFNTKTIFYPYIGGSVGYTSLAFSSSVGSSPTESGFSWGVRGGGKINAFGNALINIGISYYSESYNYTQNNNDVKNRWNILGVTAGLSIFFR
jgi:hypothetical protein